MLNENKSLCERNQKIIISKDAKQSRMHCAENPKRKEVYHYRVDGEIIKDTKRCDFLLLNESDKTAYLIELKGAHLQIALEQLSKTEEILKSELSNYKVLYRCVLSKAKTHEIESSNIKRFKIKNKNKLKYETRKMTEII